MAKESHATSISIIPAEIYYGRVSTLIQLANMLDLIWPLPGIALIDANLICPNSDDSSSNTWHEELIPSAPSRCGERAECIETSAVYKKRFGFFVAAGSIGEGIILRLCSGERNVICHFDFQLILIAIARLQ